MTKWIGCVYACIPSRLDLLLTHPFTLPAGHHSALSQAPRAIRQPPTSCLFYPRLCTYVDHNLSVHRTLPFLPSVHTSILYVDVSVLALQTGSSELFFQRFYMYSSIYDFFFSFWLTSLCVTESRSICISTHDSIPSLFHSWVIFPCIYVPHLLYPSPLSIDT